MGISGNEAGRMIANANSIIKVCQVLLMLPFTPLLVKATYFIIRGNDEEDKKFELAYISSKHAMSPTTAVLQAVREMERMAQMAETNLIRAMNTLVTRDQKEIDEVYRVEENINFLNKEITNYLVHLNQASLPTSDVMRIGALFHVVNDIERIGDHAENVADSAVQMTNDNVTFSKQGELDLSEMLDMVLKILDESIEMFAKNDLQHLQEIIDIENSIDQEERDLQQKHVERLTRNECTPEAGMIFSDLVSGLERVADHATNIAFSILDEDPKRKQPARQLQEQKNKKWIKRIGENLGNIGVMFQKFSFMLMMFFIYGFLSRESGQSDRRSSGGQGISTLCRAG